MPLSLFTPDVQLGFASLSSAAAVPLFDAEKRSTSGFAPARLREFMIGRNCARMAMRALLHEPAAIPQEADRSPRWPTGIVGSISHSATWCAAAAARIRNGYLSLGIDIEPLAPLPEGTENIVLSGTEQSWISRQPESYRHLLGRLFFSAKECAYKCQYPLSRRLLGFQAMEIRVDWAERSFQARFNEDAPPFRRRDLLHGRFDIENGHFICGAELRHRGGTNAIEASRPSSFPSLPCSSIPEVCP